jgi:hypothetical protein
MAVTGLVRTPRAGGAGGAWFDALPEETGGLLVGVRVTAAAGRVKAIRPVFRSEAGQNEDGPAWFGRGGGNPTDLIAKDGYAVGAITVKAGTRVDGLSVTFMRVKANGMLDPRDGYPSAWFGGTGATKEITLGGTGKAVVGLTGRSGLDLDALGLVIKK